MLLPIVTPAPVVVSHGDAFRDLFDNQREFRYFQNYLTLDMWGISQHGYREEDTAWRPRRLLHSCETYWNRATIVII